MGLRAIFVALTVTAAIPVLAQAPASATEGRFHFKAGAGFSDFNGDFGHGHLMGGALWVDCNPAIFPPALRGLGVEAEGRGVRIGQISPTEHGSFRQGTLGGGPMYTYLHFRNVHPYVKFLFNFAGQDFNLGNSQFHHETQVAYAPGGGVDYRVFRNLWARADYEYQVWPGAYGRPAWTLDPQGATLGLSFDFGHFHRR